MRILATRIYEVMQSVILRGYAISNICTYVQKKIVSHPESQNAFESHVAFAEEKIERNTASPPNDVSGLM